MIVQNVSAEGHTDISFTLPKSDMRRARRCSEPLAGEIGARGLAHDPEIAKISLVGAGMRTHPGVAADMFDALAEAGINIGIISTSAVRISCVVPAAEVERAVQVVHERFKLHEPVVTAEPPSASPARALAQVRVPEDPRRGGAMGPPRFGKLFELERCRPRVESLDPLRGGEQGKVAARERIRAAQGHRRVDVGCPRPDPAEAGQHGAHSVVGQRCRTRSPASLARPPARVPVCSPPSAG